MNSAVGPNKQIINLAPIRRKKVSGDNKLLTGIDYIPPLNARAKIEISIRSKEESSQVLAGAGKGHVDELPKRYSWTNSDHVKQYQGWKTLPRKLISNPPNQYSCGSCYAVSCATMLADRYAIFHKKNLIPLSASYILTCMPKSEKCGGGYPGAVGKFLELQGIPQETCYDYSWCSENKECKQGLSETTLNQFVPKCLPNNCQNHCTPDKHKSSCSAQGSPQFYRCAPNSTQALVRPRDIQIDILRNGPVVAVFRVFGDFIMGPLKDHWAKTNGIYSHIEHKDIYGYDEISCRDGKKKKPYKCYMGNHAVVIVGWDYDDKTKTPYWIVRNSWGSDWNKNGYFHMAFSDPDTGINMLPALDRPIQIGQNYFGGATTFRPLSGTVIGSVEVRKRKNILTIIFYIATVIFIISFIRYLFLHFRSQKRVFL